MHSQAPTRSRRGLRSDACVSWPILKSGTAYPLVNGSFFFLLLRRLVDHSLGNFVRHFFVPFESLREGRPALGHGLQGAGVAVELRLGNDRANTRPARAGIRIGGLRPEDLAAT